MSNLTISENLVREVPLAPIPGHALVVYKRINGGRTFQAELSPEEQFKEEKTSWWKRYLSDPPSYTAYAVNLNEQLKLKFSRRILLQNQIDGFDLIFRLKYRISSPRKVVERISEDPLSNLQNEIIDIVADVFSNAEWDAIRDRFNPIADDALAITRDEIDALAAHWGFTIETLKLERQLPEPELQIGLIKKEKTGEVERHRIEAEAEKKRREIEHQKALHQAGLDHEGTLYNVGLEQKRQEVQHGHTLRQEKLDYERKQKELEYQNSLHGQELENRLAKMLQENLLSDNDLMRKIRTGGADAAVEALKNIAGETTSPRQLEEALNVLQRLALKQPSGGARMADMQVLGAMKAPAALLSAQNGELGVLPKVAELLMITFQVVEGVSYTAAEKTRLLSALMHLAAEAMLGEEADEEKLKVHQKNLEDVVTKFSFLPEDLEHFLRDNYRGLRERLK
jgi:hypothetical protein